MERGICADPLLLALEAELNKAYWDEGLARDQRRWLRRRDRTCADRPVAACLAPLYRERIEVLRLTSYMDPTVVDWAVVLHGRWRVQPLTEPFPADAEVPIPFWDGATVWQTEEGLCMRGDNDARMRSIATGRFLAGRSPTPLRGALRSPKRWRHTGSDAPPSGCGDCR